MVVMKKTLALVIVVSFALCLVATDAYSRRGGEPSGGVVIMISPGTLVLDSPGGANVTVHTNLPLGSVDRASVKLSGIPALTTFADSCGNLVAKFGEAAVKSIVEPPAATLTLTGKRTDGTTFAASETIQVK